MEFQLLQWDPGLNRFVEQTYSTTTPEPLVLDIAFSASNPPSWVSGTSPSSVSDALDQLAAKSGGGGSDYAHFFALMPGDNSATVAVATAVQFPQNGPTSAGSVTRLGPSTFNLAAAGTYEVTWQVSVAEPGQLMLKLNGAELPDTVVGRATGTNQLYGNSIIQVVTPNSVLSVVNPSGNSTALTITPIAGGTHPVSATVTIKKL